VSIEALTAEIMDDFTDALAPEWAGEAAVCWAAAQNEAAEAGSDPDAMFREFYADRFTPTDEAQMEWCLRKRQKALHDADTLQKHMEYELQALREAFAKHIRKADQEAAFWNDMAERGILATEPDSKGKRTMRTVVGTIFVTRRKTMHLPDDADALLALGEALHVEPRVTIAPDKSGIKAALEIVESDGELLVIDKATGEPVDSVTAEITESVTVK
jgi:hypothetical protein